MEAKQTIEISLLCLYVRRRLLAFPLHQNASFHAVRCGSIRSAL
mgnify:FL=1